MKTKAIVATLLLAAAASADARFAWPYPRRAVSPDESGHWIVIKWQFVATQRGIRAHNGEAVPWRTGRAKIVAS